MVVCVVCEMPACGQAVGCGDVVSVTRRSSGVAPRACVRVYARVLVPPNLYIHTHVCLCLVQQQQGCLRVGVSRCGPAAVVGGGWWGGGVRCFVP